MQMWPMRCPRSGVAKTTAESNHHNLHDKLGLHHAASARNWSGRGSLEERADTPPSNLGAFGIGSVSTKCKWENFRSAHADHHGLLTAVHLPFVSLQKLWWLTAESMPCRVRELCLGRLLLYVASSADINKSKYLVRSFRGSHSVGSDLLVLRLRCCRATLHLHLSIGSDASGFQTCEAQNQAPNQSTSRVP